MAKQEELRALLNTFKETVRIDARYAHLDGPASNETSGVAEKRIFSFFDQMRKTIDGLSADVERRVQVNRALTAERDEAVRQVQELFPMWQAACCERDQLRKYDEQAKYTFVPFDPARNGEGLEVLVGMPGSGEWLPADYIGKSPKGFHVVEAEGRGIVAITDPEVGLRYRVKQKTVTLWANYSDNALKHPAFDGCVGWLYATEDIAKNYSVRRPATPHAVTITVAE